LDASDVERVLSICHGELSDILRISGDPKNKEKSKAALRNVERLAGKLKRALEEFDQTAVVEESMSFSRVLGIHSRAWFSHIGRGSDTTPRSSIPPIEFLLERLAFAAKISLKRRSLSGQSHRPKELLLVNAADVVGSAWVLLSLLSGSSVAKSFPTGRNPGMRWCTEVLIGVAEKGWCGPVRKHKDGWSVRRIEDAIREAIADLKNWLTSEASMEEEDEWSSVFWDSAIGFYFMLVAAQLVEAKDLLVPHSHADAFYADEANGPFGYSLG
jgi:hypothetical protein